MKALILSEAMKKNSSENQSSLSECRKYFKDMISLWKWCSSQKEGRQV